MKPTITLTGADEHTPRADLSMLAAMGAEIGLLYTFDPEGRHRYPPRDWIEETCWALREHVAVHVCGKRAREELKAGRLGVMLRYARRIQVNGTLQPLEHDRLCSQFSGHWIITQYRAHHHPANASLAWSGFPNHAILVDDSGGLGVLPPKWLRPDTPRPKPVGFAGGLSPDNLATELPKIAAVAIGSWWVDMESSLRDAEDWFSIERAVAALEAFNRWGDR